VLTALLQFLAIAWSQSCNGQEIDVQSAIREIAQHENRISAISWNVRTEAGRFANAKDPNTFTATESPLEASVLFDVKGMRYKSSVWGVTGHYTTLPDGEQHEEMLGQRIEYSFDGKLHRHWDKRGIDSSIPARDAQSGWATGEISHNVAQRVGGVGCLAAYGGNAGVHRMPPFFTLDLASTTPKLLSSQLHANASQGRLVKINKTNSGRWDITTYARTGADGIDDLWDIVYDPERAIVLSARRYNSKQAIDRNEDFELEYLHFEWKQADGFWYPAKITSILPANGIGGYWIISNVIFNPPVEQKDFLIDFPPGVRIDDHVAGQTYISGRPITDMSQDGESGGIGTGRVFAITGTAILVIVLLFAVMRKWLRSPLEHNELQ
jgi:hypothetical protein